MNAKTWGYFACMNDESFKRQSDFFFGNLLNSSFAQSILRKNQTRLTCTKYESFIIEVMLNSLSTYA